MTLDPDRDPLASVEDLRELARLAPQLGAVGERAAAALESYLAGACAGVTLDQAFGVAPRRGAWPWWRLEQRRRERAATRQLLGEFDSIDEAHRWLGRYAAGRGRHGGGAEARAVAARAVLEARGGRVPESARTLARAGNADS